jgi:hypothetical protein
VAGPKQRKSFFPAAGSEYSVPADSIEKALLELGPPTSVTNYAGQKVQLPFTQTTPNASPVDGNLGTGVAIAAVGFDELSGQHWANQTGGRVVDLQQGPLNAGRALALGRYLPCGLRDQIRMAQNWRENDELLESLISIKRKFAVVGFSMQTKQSKFTKEEQDTIDEHQEKLDDLVIDTRLYNVISDLFTDYFTTQNAVLYWRTKPLQTDMPIQYEPVSDSLPNVYDICSLNPADCDYKNSLGVDRLYVDIPRELRERIEVALRKVVMADKIAAIAELVHSGVGFKWIDAVKNGKSQVLLDRNDGDNWLVITDQRKHHGFKKPTMFNIFLPLNIRKMFNEGEFVGSYLMKHFIMMIKQGESISGSGLENGSRKNWLTQPEANALTTMFSNTSLAMRLAVNHTTKVEFIFPPPEMFSPERYASCEQKIFNWSGVIAAIMKGEGGTYSSAFIGIKKLVADIYDARRRIGEALSLFFKDASIQADLQTPDGCRVMARFDENVLKEPKQLLDEIKALLLSGVLDPRSALYESGRDPDIVVSRKYRCQEENDTDQTWEPVYDINSVFNNSVRGGPADNQGGRPANPDTTQGEGTRTQSPGADY